MFATIGLMALMAATRFHHFGTSFSLPDASLAVFFLGGLWVGGRYLFISLLLEAGLIDYVATTLFGVSDFCITPAYFFLIPTYSTLWFAGKWCSQFSSLTAINSAQQFAMLLSATATAFLISNFSFDLFSGHYPAGAWTQYLDSYVQYFPPYLLSTLLYTLLIFGSVRVAKAVLAAKNTHKVI
jgi:hypothetical protein